MEDLAFYEQTILGGIINGSVKPSEVNIDASDFIDEDRARLLTLAKAMERDGRNIDADSLYLRFAEGDGGWLSRGDLDIWADTNRSVSAVGLAVQKVKGRSLAKFVSASAMETLDAAVSGPAMIARFRKMIEIADKDFTTVSSEFILPDEAKRIVSEWITELHEGKTVAIPTGFTRWDDNLLDGFAKGDLHVIVGITGAGKSALALNCALHQSKAGSKVVFVSREMSLTENVARLLSTDSHIPRWQIRKNLNVSLESELQSALAAMPLPTFNTETSGIETLCLQAKVHADQHGLDILYVDYLQLMESERKHSTRANEVQYISRTLKKLAMDLQVPVVALCQFNRGAPDAKITELIHHLKDSSGIEQDASTISVIQVKPTVGQSNDLIDAELFVIKNRNGQTFRPVPLKFNGQLFRFSEVTNDF